MLRAVPLVIAILIFCQGLDIQAEDKTKKLPAVQVFKKLTYKQALEKAKARKKVVLLDFSTSWCGWCRKLEADTFGQSKVRNYLSRRTVAIKVDGDKEKALVQQYEIRGYPTLVFVNGNGKEIGRIVGYRKPEPFLQQAQKVIGKK